MTDFSLIKSLQSTENKTKLPPGHKYVKLNVIVENENITVHIPEKEAKSFETEYKLLSEQGYFNKYLFNKAMRMFRGIRG